LYISGVHFQRCSNFSIFFPQNVTTIFFTYKGEGQAQRLPHKYGPNSRGMIRKLSVCLSIWVQSSKVYMERSIKEGEENLRELVLTKQREHTS